MPTGNSHPFGGAHLRTRRAATGFLVAGAASVRRIWFVLLTLGGTLLGCARPEDDSWTARPADRSSPQPEGTESPFHEQVSTATVSEPFQSRFDSRVEAAPEIRLPVTVEGADSVRAEGFNAFTAGNYPRAIEQLTQVVLKNANDGQARMALARALAATGKDHLAIVHLDRLLEAAPDSRESRYFRGTLHVQRKNFDAGIRDLQQVVESPDPPHAAYVSLAAALLQTDRISEAERMADRYLASPGDAAADAYHIRCAARIRQGRREAAEEDVQEFEKLRPSDPAIPRLRSAIESLAAAAKQ